MKAQMVLWGEKCLLSLKELWQAAGLSVELQGEDGCVIM
jgi:hypothetical protein